MPGRGQVVRPQSIGEQEVLQALGLHRLLTTGQFRRLYAPSMSQKKVAARLREIADDGLIGYLPRGLRAAHLDRSQIWYLTEQGGAQAARDPDLSDLNIWVQPKPKASIHTLYTNEVGVVLAEWAARHGDRFGPSGWLNEVELRYKDGPVTSPRGKFRPDAVLYYDAHHREEDPDSGRVRERIAYTEACLELDRDGNVSRQRMGHKFRRYVWYLDYVAKGARHPAWVEEFKQPPTLVLVVLAGDSREELKRRREELIGVVHSDPVLQEQWRYDPELADIADDDIDPKEVEARRVRFLIGLLDDLKARGPYRGVFVDAATKQRVDMFGRPPATDAGEAATATPNAVP